MRIEKAQFAGELLVRQRQRRCGDRLPFLEKRLVRLVDLRLNPNGAEVSQVVERRPFIDGTPLALVLLDDVTVNRRGDRELGAHLAGAEKLLDLLVADVP